MKRAHSTSAASADARVDSSSITKDTESVVLKNDDVKEDRKNSNKRARFKGNNKGRRGGAAYDRTPKTQSLMIVPRKRYFPVHVSNRGCESLCRDVYRVIQGKDFRLAQNITQHQLAYVTCIAFCNRLVQTAVTHGYAIPLDASRLKQVATGIQLPTVLAKYIESVGIMELSSGASVAPFAAHYEQLVQLPTMLDPADILRFAGRQVPPGAWALDIDWIVDYNDATTRASRSGMNFRTVNNSTYVGTSEMLVSYLQLPDEMLLPKAPQQMTEAEAQLGAAYRYRDWNLRNQWGENVELLHDTFTAIPFDSRILVSDLCVAAFRGDIISKE